MTRWYTDLDVICDDDHERNEMVADGPVAHGQSCLFECPTCDRTLLVENTPPGDEVTARVIEK
jgi:hypothetical protein